MSGKDFDWGQMPDPYWVRQYLDQVTHSPQDVKRGRGSGFLVGDRVRKKEGYAFDSIVVAVFRNRKGEVRLVCESDLIEGMLHIFRPRQMELREKPDDGQDTLC